jgi:hypothetical protein
MAYESAESMGSIQQMVVSLLFVFTEIIPSASILRIVYGRRVSGMSMTVVLSISAVGKWEDGEHTTGSRKEKGAT